MKKSVMAVAVVALFVGLCFISQAQAQALKIGVYDSNRIIKESKTIDGYNKALMKSIEGKRGPLADKDKSVRALTERLQKESATLSGADRKALEDKLVSEDKELRRLREDIELDFRRIQAELRQKAVVDIKDATKKIGDREKFDLIFEKNNAGIVYMKDAMDITGKILTQMK